MLTRIWRLRLATLLGAGSLTVHELRFLLDTSPGPAHQVHAYVAVLAPALLLALLFAAGDFLARLGQAGCVASTPAAGRLWAYNSAALIVIYVLQELLEGFAASTDNPGGIGALLTGGGWLAIPLSLATGLAIALLMRGAVAADGWAASRAVRTRPPRAAPLLAFAHADSARAVRGPLSRHLAARGPPAETFDFGCRCSGLSAPESIAALSGDRSLRSGA